jgi:hypothetical protein
MVVNLFETLRECDRVMNILTTERFVKHTSPIEVVAGIQNHERVHPVTQSTHDVCHAGLRIVVQIVTLGTRLVLTVDIMHGRVTWATGTTPIANGKEVQIIPWHSASGEQVWFHAIDVLHEKQSSISRSLSPAVRVQLALTIQVRENRAPVALRAQIGALIESLPIEKTSRSPW